MFNTLGEDRISFLEKLFATSSGLDNETTQIRPSKVKDQVNHVKDQNDKNLEDKQFELNDCYDKENADKFIKKKSVPKEFDQKANYTKLDIEEFFRKNQTVNNSNCQLEDSCYDNERIRGSPKLENRELQSNKSEISTNIITRKNNSKALQEGTQSFENKTEHEGNSAEFYEKSQLKTLKVSSQSSLEIISESDSTLTMCECDSKGNIQETSAMKKSCKLHKKCLAHSTPNHTDEECSLARNSCQINHLNLNLEIQTDDCVSTDHEDEQIYSKKHFSLNNTATSQNKTLKENTQIENRQTSSEIQAINSGSFGQINFSDPEKEIIQGSSVQLFPVEQDERTKSVLIKSKSPSESYFRKSKNKSTLSSNSVFEKSESPSDSAKKTYKRGSPDSNSMDNPLKVDSKLSCETKSLMKKMVKKSSGEKKISTSKSSTTKQLRTVKEIDSPKNSYPGEANGNSKLSELPEAIRSDIISSKKKVKLKSNSNEENLDVAYKKRNSDPKKSPLTKKIHITEKSLEISEERLETDLKILKLNREGLQSSNLKSPSTTELKVLKGSFEQNNPTEMTDSALHDLSSAEKVLKTFEHANTIAIESRGKNMSPEKQCSENRPDEIICIENHVSTNNTPKTKKYLKISPDEGKISKSKNFKISEPKSEKSSDINHKELITKEKRTIARTSSTGSPNSCDKIKKKHRQGKEKDEDKNLTVNENKDRMSNKSERNSPILPISIERSKKIKRKSLKRSDIFQIPVSYAKPDSEHQASIAVSTVSQEDKIFKLRFEKSEIHKNDLEENPLLCNSSLNSEDIKRKKPKRKLCKLAKLLNFLRLLDSVRVWRSDDSQTSKDYDERNSDGEFLRNTEIRNILKFNETTQLISENIERSDNFYDSVIDFIHNEQKKKLKKYKDIIEVRLANNSIESSDKCESSLEVSLSSSLMANLDKDENQFESGESASINCTRNFNDSTDCAKRFNDNSDIDNMKGEILNESMSVHSRNYKSPLEDDRSTCLDLKENTDIKTLGTLQRPILTIPSDITLQQKQLLNFSSLNLKRRYQQTSSRDDETLRASNKLIRESLFSDRIMAFGDELLRPYTTLPTIKEFKKLSAIGRYGEMSKPESVAWPVLLHEYSLLMVTPHMKEHEIDMTFILPLVKIIGEIKFKTSSPIAIVISQTWQMVENIAKILRKVTNEKGYPPRKIIAACGNGTSNDIDVLLLNGCDVLVCTASLFQLAVERKHIRLDKTQFVCIHNAHLVFQLYSSALDTFMKDWSFVLHKNLKLLPQIVVITDHLTDEVIHFFNVYMKPLITHVFICNPTVAARFGPIQLAVKCCDDETSLFDLIGRELSKSKNKKIVIYTTSTYEADSLAMFLNQQYFLKTEFLKTRVSNSWQASDTDPEYAIKLTLPGYPIPLYDADILAYTFIPKQREIYENLSWVFENLAKKVGRSLTHRKNIKLAHDPTMLLFPLKSNFLQFSTLSKMLKAFGQPLPKKLISWITEDPKSLQKKTNKSDLCHILLSYGTCYKFDRCLWRHEIDKVIDLPKDFKSEIPVGGKIKLSIVHLQNAISYFARLNCYENRNGEIVDVQREFTTLKIAMSDYYSTEKNRIPLKSRRKSSTSRHCIEEGAFGAIKLEEGVYARVRIEDVQQLSRDRNNGLIRVHLIDNGPYKEVKAAELLRLPSYLAKKPAQLVKIRLARVRPIDDFVQWHDNVTRFVETNVVNKNMSAQVLIATRDTLVVDHLREEKSLKYIGTITPYDTIRRKLLDKNMAISNPLHITNLFRLFSDHIDTSNFGYTVHGEPVKLQKSTLNIGDIVKIVSAGTPTNFYARIHGNETATLDSFLENDKKDSLPIEVDWDAPTFVLGKSINGWLRAKVLDRYENTFKVLFIDNAECSELPQSDIKCLKSKHLKKPFGAVHCRVNNFLCNKRGKNRVKDFLNMTKDSKYKILDLKFDKKNSVYDVSLVNSDHELKSYDLGCLLQSFDFGSLDKDTFENWFPVDVREDEGEQRANLRLLCRQIIYNNLDTALENFEIMEDLEILVAKGNLKQYGNCLEFIIKVVILLKKDEERAKLLKLYLDLLVNNHDNEKKVAVFSEKKILSYVSHLDYLWPDLCKSFIYHLATYEGYNRIIFEDKSFFKTIKHIFNLNQMGCTGRLDFCIYICSLIVNGNTGLE